MDEKELEQELQTVAQKAGGIVIKTQDDFALAGKMLIDIDGMIKRVKSYWKGPKEAAHQAHKAITAKEAEMLKPLTSRREGINKIMSAWQLQKRREAEAEQRRQDEERRKREEAERAKLERAAARAEEKGNEEKAESLREKAADVFIPPVIVKSEAEKTTWTDAGTVSVIEDIKVTVTDVKAVLNAIIAGTLPIGIVTINEAKLKAAVKLAGIKRLDGVIIEDDIRTSVRGTA